ncbi:MAG: polysaccharide deacetylase family protein [Acidimicrobiales bacterium]
MEDETEGQAAPISRRTFLARAGRAGAGAAALAAGGGAAAAGLAACGGGGSAHGGGAQGAGAASVPTEPESTATPAPSSSVPPTAAAAPGAPAVAVANGPRDRQQVALTFHWGPGDLSVSRQLLDETIRAQVPITVFAVGQWFEQHPQLASLVLGAGHEMDNHTYTHPTLTRLGRGAVAEEIRRCQRVLAREAPKEGRYFRPSGTDHATELILAEAGAAGYATVVDFDVDPRDYADPGANAVVSRVRAQLQPGSIVSLHFGHPGTVAAFPRIVSDLRSRGLTPVRLRDLLG